MAANLHQLQSACDNPFLHQVSSPATTVSGPAEGGVDHHRAQRGHAQLKELAVITVHNLAMYNCNECLIIRLAQF